VLNWYAFAFNLLAYVHILIEVTYTSLGRLILPFMYDTPKNLSIGKSLSIFRFMGKSRRFMASRSKIYAARSKV
jgi:hypothetical protein